MSIIMSSLETIFTTGKSFQIRKELMPIVAETLYSLFPVYKMLFSSKVMHKFDITSQKYFIVLFLE